MWREDEEMRAKVGEMWGKGWRKAGRDGKKWTKVGVNRAIFGKSISNLYFYKNILALIGRKGFLVINLIFQVFRS